MPLGPCWFTGKKNIKLKFYVCLVFANDAKLITAFYSVLQFDSMLREDAGHVNILKFFFSIISYYNVI